MRVTNDVIVSRVTTMYVRSLVDSAYTTSSTLMMTILNVMVYVPLISCNMRIVVHVVRNGVFHKQWAYSKHMSVTHGSP
jgi:hypothetical protein